MRPGESLEVRIERGVYRGRGLARVEGRVVLVPGAFPGEKVRVRLEQVHPDYAEARLEQVLTPSELRRDPPCPHAAACGGCSYQGLQLSAQRELKREILLETLARSGIEWSGELEVVSSPESGWRTRARLHFGRDGDGRLRLGFHHPASQQVVDVQHCLQLTPGLQSLLAGLRSGLGAIESFESAPLEALIAESSQGEDRVLALRFASEPKEKRECEALAGALPGLTGFGLAIGERERPDYVGLRGGPFLVSRFPEGPLRSHVLSFFQGNRVLLSELVSRALAPLDGASRVLELYSGVGLFSLPLSNRVERLRAVEGSRYPVQDARHNLAGRRNVDLIRAPVERDASQWLRQRFEAALLDPPRQGAGKPVVDALARAGVSRIAYVSCDPTTLARDLRRLQTHGYRLTGLTLLDLFPDTFHLETVASLVRD